MFKRSHTVVAGIKNALYATASTIATTNIRLQNILVVSKLSRYEFERIRHGLASDEQLERELRTRGTDVDCLRHYHDLHKRFEAGVTSTLHQMGLNVDCVNRFDYTAERVAWADIVLPTGGDGTFLLAASRVHNNRVPVVGLNSDPNRSEGHLCLPKAYSSDVRGAIERLNSGLFTWLQRSRIRLKLMRPSVEKTTQVDATEQHQPQYLHEAGLPPSLVTHTDQQLPVLALNEVFVGETFSARVSHLRMRLNGGRTATSIKCSGVCICTGTGSTSWHLSINRLPAQSVAELLELSGIRVEPDMVECLTQKYNKHLTFSADDGRMGYTIRDLISARVWPYPKGIKSRGLATSLTLKSNCFEGSLVIDGGVSYPFNDGAEAVLGIQPEDSLRTVVFDD